MLALRRASDGGRRHLVGLDCSRIRALDSRRLSTDSSSWPRQTSTLQPRAWLVPPVSAGNVECDPDSMSLRHFRDSLRIIVAFQIVG